MDNFKQRVGKKIRKRREEKGFSTQLAFAKAFPLDDRTRIAKWESGAQLPEGKNRARLLELLDMEEKVLFAEFDDEHPKPTALELKRFATEAIEGYQTLVDNVPDHVLQALKSFSGDWFPIERALGVAPEQSAKKKSKKEIG